MNLSNIELKLFKAEITNISLLNYDGEHIGSDMPTRSKDDMVVFREFLYIAGFSMNQVASFLSINQIYATNITEVNILIDVSNHPR